MKSDSFDILLDGTTFDLTGQASYISWAPSKQPMLLVTGSTGSGKTVFLTLLMAKIGKLSKGKLYLVDYKGHDFRFAHDTPRMYSFMDVGEGINEVYQILMDRQSGKDTSTLPIYLVIEEWSGYLNALSKKDADEIKSKVGNLLALGRGFNIFVILSLQRPDSTYFPNGARDNFGFVVSLGRLSKEGVSMLFSDWKDELDPNYGSRGRGWCIQGNKLHRCIVPLLLEQQRAEPYIITALTR